MVLNIIWLNKNGYHISFTALYWCRRFNPGGVPGLTSKLSLRVPAQMGRHEMEHKGEKRGTAARVILCPGRMHLQ
jgi:hypothetical protein